MYNEQQKRRFIREQIENTKRAYICESVFEALAPYEEQWGADFSTRSPEELRPIFENITGLRESSQISILIVIRSYIRWLLSQGIEGVQEGILSIDTLGISKVRSMTVKNPVHLHQCLNDTFEPETEQMVDNIYRCYYWLAYAGMEENDILAVKCSDVDLDRQTVFFNGTSYHIYEEVLFAVKNAATLPTFVYKNRNYTEGKKIMTRLRAPGDTLIRGFRASSSPLVMRAELSKRSRIAMENGRTTMKLSYHRVQLSGVFYRMYEKEIRGLPVDFSVEAELFMKRSADRRNGQQYKLDSGRNTIDAKRRQIERDYLNDYERWKIAWSVL